MTSRDGLRINEDVLAGVHNFFWGRGPRGSQYLAPRAYTSGFKVNGVGP